MRAKTALITGTSRPHGLGLAVARQLAENDYHVFLTARNVGQAESLAADLRRAGHEATALRLDVSDRSTISTLAAHLDTTIDGLDVLINNASAMPDFDTRSALEVDIDALRLAFDVTVFGCWALIQALLPLMLRAPAARIVNVSSEAAMQVAKARLERIILAGSFICEVYA